MAFGDAEPTMTFFFDQHDGDRARHDDDDAAAPGLTCVPAAVLQRHGARVLNPSDAAVLPGYPAAAGDRIPGQDPADPGRPAARVGLPRGGRRRAGRHRDAPIGAPADREPSADRAGQPAGRRGPAAAAPPGGAGPGAPPRGQAGGAGRGRRVGGAAGPARRGRDAGTRAWTSRSVRRIALEHLLIGSAITGSPATEGNGVTGQPGHRGQRGHRAGQHRFLRVRRRRYARAGRRFRSLRQNAKAAGRLPVPAPGRRRARHRRPRASVAGRAGRSGGRVPDRRRRLRRRRPRAPAGHLAGGQIR